ncbi:MAG: phosphatase PAP2 family protein [Actinomyces sp.]|uniref:phosphatase PAP2 family protein n=1 Tax=Actinomyces sp. TaxID=29317 RepID=UPI0026DC6B48|nr:phosphatase PAP2 family protein [Actinomyces sp.]MDO4243444.1 phosphatase PAP2 family protein [Actinomyces sp.]
MPVASHPLLSRLPASWRTPAAALLAVGAAGALAVFAWLADSAVEADDLAFYDPSVTSWAVAGRNGPATVVAWFFTHLGGTVGLTVLTALGAAAFLWRGRRTHALVLVAAMLGSSLLTVVLKIIFGRARPSTALLLGDAASSYSFPSGHSFNTAVFAGTLAGFVVFATVPRRRKLVAALAAAVVTVMVGLSRIYLAYHWLTDVLAGWSIGVAWLCLVALATMAVRERRRPALRPSVS